MPNSPILEPGKSLYPQWGLHKWELWTVRPFAQQGRTSAAATQTHRLITRILPRRIRREEFVRVTACGPSAVLGWAKKKVPDEAITTEGS